VLGSNTARVMGIGMLTKVFRDFSHFLQASFGILPLLGQDIFIQNPFQFFFNQSSYP
jgi:hypothetical protein